MEMKALVCIFAMFLALECPGFAQTASPDSGEALKTRLKAFLEQPRFAQAQWGVKVMSQETGKALFEYNADKLMVPASNAKLFTCALALDRLGPEYRIKTSIKTTVPPDTNGVVRGDLIVYGRGDPSISARFNKGDHSKLLKPLVDAVLGAGIKRVEGDLVGDESYFRSPPHGNGWAWDDFQWAYGAPVSALSFDDNAIGVTVKPWKQIGDPCQIIVKTGLLTFHNSTKTTAKASDLELYRPNDSTVVYVSGGLPKGGANYADSLAIPAPALWFSIQFKEALAQAGVSVGGRARSVNWLEPLGDASKTTEIGSVESRLIREIVKETMKASQNQYAQLLLLQVGAQKQLSRKQALTDQAGLAEMQKFLAEAGVKPGSVILKDGAGLAAGCLITPEAAVSLLVFMAHHRHAAAYAESLPIAGVDGTLRDRFKNTPAQGRIWAKTGTKEFTSALSGYAVTKNNEHLVFSVILNNYKEASGNASARVETDAVAQMLVAQ